MSYLNDFVLGATVSCRFTTVQASGAPTTLSGSPVIKCYESGNTTPLTGGITLTVDYNSVTGLNNVAIVASGGNSYQVGQDYDIVITTGTVNSVSVVGYVVGTFSIQNRYLSPSVIATGIWQDTTAGDFTAANSVGKSVMNGVSLGTGLTIAAVSGAVGSVTGAVGSVTGAVGSVTGAVGSVTGAVGSVTAAVTISGDLSATMKTSVTTAATAATPVIDPASVVASVATKTGYALTAAYDPAKTAAQSSDITTALTNVGLTSNGVTKIAGHTLQDAGTGGQKVGA